MTHLSRARQPITVCDQADEACPVSFGTRQRLPWSFGDPSKATGTDDEHLEVYRQVRDGIRERIERSCSAKRARERYARRLGVHEVADRSVLARALPPADRVDRLLGCVDQEHALGT